MKIKIIYAVNGMKYGRSRRETDHYSIEIKKSASRTTVTLIPKTEMTLVSAAITEEYIYEKGDTIFLNGYQSWTDTREYELKESFRNISQLKRSRIPLFRKFVRKANNKYHFENYGDSWFYKYSPDKLHGFSYTYIRRGGDAHFIGSLNEENAWLITEHCPKQNKLTLLSDCGGRVINEPFVLFDYVTYDGQYMQVQKKYFSLFGEKNTPAISGYTSWYNDFQNISEEKMYSAMSAMDSSAYDLFQIDDGFETYVGDWLDIDKTKFPNGLKPLADKIHEKGMKAGIWLAPFVAEKESRLFKEHPEWLAKKSGEVIFAGYNWSGDAALDLMNPDVIAYIRKCLRFYIDQGFDFFKLDFLYAAALCDTNGKYTRAEIMRKAMKLLREELGDKLFLGCGVPLSSAQGLVDYCRIGTDVSLAFDDKFYMRLAHREPVSTKLTIQNTIYRYPMDGHWFRNDPDVFLLRDNNIKL